MSKNVSLKAIASALGVSINTVSHALRDMDDISDAMKSKVRKTAIEMGYIPNHVAQMMKTDERAVVGVCVEDFSNLYFNTLNEELRKLFFEREDYSLVFLCWPQFNVEVIKQCVLQRVDLLICFAEIDEKTADFARLNNIKIVCVGSFTNPENRYDHVCVDDECGCKLVARYLFNPYYNGEYVYVGTFYEFHEMRSGYFSQELVSLQKDVVIINYGLETEDISEICRRIDNGCRKIFCFNDEYAYRLLEELDKHYTDVRRLYPDLDIVGFDGLGRYVHGLRRIPTVKIDYEQFAKTIYGVVEERLNNPKAPVKKVVLPVTLYRGIG